MFLVSSLLLELAAHHRYGTGLLQGSHDTPLRIYDTWPLTLIHVNFHIYQKFRNNIVSAIFNKWVGGACVVKFPCIFLKQSSLHLLPFRVKSTSDQRAR